MSVFQICTNNKVYDTFSNLHEAQKKLKEYAEERKNRFGVHCFEMNENSFSFLLGWEEIQVSFYIKEILVQE